MTSCTDTSFQLWIVSQIVQFYKNTNKVIYSSNIYLTLLDDPDHEWGRNVSSDSSFGPLQKLIISL